MSRQLDLQLYLLLNGHDLKEIPEDRYIDYMREQHFSTEPYSMVDLLKTMTSRGVEIVILNIGQSYSVRMKKGSQEGESLSDCLLMAVAMAVYKFYSGLDWDERSLLL